MGWFPAYRSACSGAPSLEMNTYWGTPPSPSWHTSAGSLGKVWWRFCVRPAIVTVDLCGPLHVMNKYTAMQRSICRSREQRLRWWEHQIVFPWRHYSAHANVTESVLLPPWNSLEWTIPACRIISLRIPPSRCCSPSRNYFWSRVLLCC